jgi:hypothetical protein
MGSQVTVLRGLRDGGSPWLLRVRDREVILRVAHSGRVAETATEVAAMTLASRVARADLPVADLLGHGDLWHGNTLWDDGNLTAVLDWDCAGVGPAGIDLGSLRCDAAWCHGLEAAEYVLQDWETEAGRSASSVPYWDVVAALASPPDMGWFPTSMALQGRPDLTHEVMLKRRDAFLDAALRKLLPAAGRIRSDPFVAQVRGGRTTPPGQGKAS